MMTLSILKMNQFLPGAEFRILMTGVSDYVLEEDNRVVPSFLSNKTWQTVKHLALSVEAFHGLDISMYNHPEEWTAYSKALPSKISLSKVCLERQSEKQQVASEP